MLHQGETRTPAHDLRLLSDLLERQRSPDELLITELLAQPVCGRHAHTAPVRRSHHAMRGASMAFAVAGALALIVTNGALTPRVAHAQRSVQTPAKHAAVVAAKTENLALLAALLSSPNLRQGAVALPVARVADHAFAESQLPTGTALALPAAPAAAGLETTAQLPPTYIVQPGDTLSSISLRYYGNAAFWTTIYNANTSLLSNPDLIYPGQQLGIPSTGGATPVSPPVGQGPGNYTVVSGDTLSRIAYQAYGNANRWYEIYQANANIIADPNMIYPGQPLVIPS